MFSMAECIRLAYNNGNNTFSLDLATSFFFTGVAFFLGFGFPMHATRKSNLLCCMLVLATKYHSWVYFSQGSFPLSVRGRKEPGNIGGFKPLTSGGSDRAPPIRLRNEITWMCDSKGVANKNYPQTWSSRTIKNSLLVSDGGLCNGDVVDEI